jgi:hypothetical protein
MTKPIEITVSEWKEIIQLPAIRDMWGLEEDAVAEEFAQQVYGVKFDFMAGSPGYFGDLYILQGDQLTGDPPILLVRENGKIRLTELNS